MAGDALGGVTVVEFGGYAAGPAVGKYLADFGAKVIHVESASRPDGFRLQYPPYKDNRVGVNRSGCFAIFNDSKDGVTLNLKCDEGVALARRLCRRADVVIENMRPGVMERLGLGPDRLRDADPGLIVLSTTNMGQTGPHARHPGFGSQLSSLSGFTHLTGSRDGPPNLLYGPYIDFIAVLYGGAAVLAALDRRRRTGEGAHVDLAQYEAGLQFVAGALLRHAAAGDVAHRDGNRDPVAAPHGCYRAADGWVVLSCWDDDEWGRLCRALDRPEWIEDRRFAVAGDRRVHADDLDAALRDRVGGEGKAALTARLQKARVHAAVVQSVGDLFSDPRLAARGIWQRHPHPEMGEHAYRMVAYQLSGTPGRTRRAAPCLGQHNREVFREWLGLDEEAYREAAQAGALA